MAGISAWRANDVVAYDAMRESAMVLTAILLGASNDGSSNSVERDAEIVQLRRNVLTVDSYDREAVTALTHQIAGRINELAELKS
ncbi:hypothetical protein ACSBPH_13585 [Microbacterium sp. F51-2R]|uniref:hypothetical protein n=1 Tax=Microbacterium sp. F51-2R TaxID=3445777 RepID=UPI003FA108E3